MCGRYAQARNAHELQLTFDVGPGGTPPEEADRRPPLEEVAPNHNIAPGSSVYAVLGTPPGEVSAQEAPLRRSLCTLRWGLIPSWAKDPALGHRMINARGETVADKPSFRAAFARRRCLIPADAYYEWQLLPDDAPGTTQASTSPATDPDHKRRKAKAKKRPFAVRYADSAPLAFAGLFERWRDPTREDGDPRAWVWSCTIITAAAAPALEHIHERMPVVLPSTDFATWLDPRSGKEDLLPLLGHTPAERLTSYPVATAVNSVRNNGPELLTPESEQDEGTLW